MNNFTLNNSTLELLELKLNAGHNRECKGEMNNVLELILQIL